MYKCLDCGHIFDDGEEAVSKEYHDEIPGGFYEEFDCCPICGGNFEETTRCRKCGGEFLDDELLSGYCEECLKESVTFDNFLAYAEWMDENLEDSELHTVEHFMLVWVYGMNEDYIKGSNGDFRALMMAEFKNAVEAHNRAMKFGTDDKFLEQIRDYMEDYELLDGFAEWLHDEEVRK